MRRLNSLKFQYFLKIKRIQSTIFCTRRCLSIHIKVILLIIIVFRDSFKCQISTNLLQSLQNCHKHVFNFTSKICRILVLKANSVKFSSNVKKNLFFKFLRKVLNLLLKKLCLKIQSIFVKLLKVSFEKKSSSYF